MSREVAGYREHLETVLETYPQKECLNLRDTAKFTGFDEKTVKKYIFKQAKFITRTQLARWLATNSAKGSNE